MAPIQRRASADTELSVPVPLTDLPGSAQPGIALPVRIVVPTYNEREALPETVRSLQALGPGTTLLFVDGGSSDGTVEWLEAHAIPVIRAELGRGAQLAAGGRRALSEPGDAIFWFIHADCHPQPDALARIREAIEAGAVAGACTLRFAGTRWEARGMTRFYSILNRFGLYYGDATLFVRADAYQASGGYGQHPLFEDLDLLRRLRQEYPGGFRRLSVEVVASSRRFEGLRFPFVFSQWILLQTLYWGGVSPRLLGKWYRAVR